MQEKIQLNTTVVRTKDMVSADIDGDTVMMSIEAGKYYGLDSIASQIWENIDKPIAVSELCTHLQAKYDVDAKNCQKDVLHFLNELFEEHILQIVREPIQ